MNTIGFCCVAAFALLIFVPIFNAANQAKEKESALVESERVNREADEKIQESFDKIDNILKSIDTPKLELQSRNLSFGDKSFAEVVGEVKNISDTSLDNVTVVATFYDKSGNIVTTDETLIAYQPILPGQTSPFKVITIYNPAMAKASLNFKELTGGTIEFEDKSKK